MAFTQEIEELLKETVEKEINKYGSSRKRVKIYFNERGEYVKTDVIGVKDVQVELVFGEL
tara:strand:- start:773 stop:952 length:180 start_codon:yes stop_codon:yes gene_type:complete